MPTVGGTHHVKLGTQYYLLRPGPVGYRKRHAQMFGARFTTGDPDYNNLSAWQHWVQRCWVGGFGAVEWTDDSMFDEGAGVDTTQHEVVLLARDLVRAGATNGDMDGEAYVRQFIVFESKLFCLSYGSGATPSKLWRWSVDDWILTKTFTNPARGMTVFAGKLFVGDYGADLSYMNSDYTFVGITKPAAVVLATPFALMPFNGKLYVAMGNEIWRLKDNLTWDGATAFYKAVSVDRIDHMEKHLGFLYMASRNGHILRTDGNNTFDMWEFDPGLIIVAMRSFDGRLFLGVNEPLTGTTAQEAVIYQFSGAAVTELKRWGKEGVDLTTGRMRVHGGRLYFGAGSLLGMGNGFGIAAYDPREDAYHMWSTNRDITTWTAGTENISWSVDDVIWYGGYMFCSVRGHGVFRTRLTYRDASRALATYDTTAAGGSPEAPNGGWFTSSDFDGGTPGLLKLWNAITIEADIPDTSCSLYIEYSTNGGVTWVDQGSVTKATAATRYIKSYAIGDGNDVRASRFKYRIWLRTTNTAYSPQLRSVSVRYMPIPEPNWVWDLTLILSDSQTLLDGTTEAPDNVTKLAALRTAFRNQTLLAFTEPDGTRWSSTGGNGVLIMSMEEMLPHIGPTSAGALEHEVRLSLMEIVETYD